MQQLASVGVFAKYIAAVESVCPGWTPRIYDSHVTLRPVDTKTFIQHRPAVLKDFIEPPDCLGTFDTDFINTHHMFPAGTQRKITDVFVKTPRANHLLPDADGTADPLSEMAMTSRNRKHVPGVPSGYTADKAIENLAMPFIADQIDSEAQNQKLDAMSSHTSSLEAVKDELMVVMGILHARCRTSLAQKPHARKDVSESVQL